MSTKKDREALWKERSSSSATLKEAFEKEKADIVERPKTRMVKLKYESCCGCGCDTVRLKREVPYDSDLQNGDMADDIEEDDILL